MKKTAITRDYKNFSIRVGESVLIGTAIYLFLFWFTPSASTFLLAILFGVFISLFALDRVEVFTSAFLTGFLGNFLAGLFLNANNYNYFLRTAPPGANQDVPMMLYSVSLPKIFASGLFHSIILEVPLEKRIFIAIITALLYGITAMVIFQLYKTLIPKKILVGAMVATTVFIFIWSGFIGSAPIRAWAGVPPKPETFAYDSIINMKIFYYISAGQSYYDVYRDTWMEDSRHNTNNPISTAFYFREPLSYHLWKYTAFGNAGNVFILSLLLGAVLLIAAFLAADSMLPPRFAVLTPVALLPYLIAGTTWVNIFFPDWWALLFGAIGFFLFLQKKYRWSSILMLLAAASRELIYPLLFAGLIASFWILKPQERRRALWSFIPANLLFFLIYAIHYSIASRYIPKTETLNILNRFDFANFGHGALVTTNYLMFGYGFFKVPGIVLFLIAVSGVYFLKEKAHKIFAWLFFALSLTFMAVSHVSQYWGQLYVPMAISLLPWLSRLSPNMGDKLTVKIKHKS